MNITNKNILITGGNGFIGKNLINHLSRISNNIEIAVVDMSVGQNPNVQKEYVSNMKNKKVLQDIFVDFNPNIIFHLAADKTRDRKIETFYTAIENNLLTTLNLFNAALSPGNLESIVIINTSEEYGNQPCPLREDYNYLPISPYSFSKSCISHLATLMHDLYKLPVIVLRPTLVYGYGQGREMFLADLIETLINNKIFKMTAGEQMRDYIYIDDFMELLIKAAFTKSAIGNVFNIGTKSPLKIKELALLVAEKLNKKDLLKVGALPYRENEIMEYFVDTDNTQKILGWNANTTINQGLDIILEKYLNE